MTIPTTSQQTGPAIVLTEHGKRAVLLASALMLSACGGGGTIAPSGTPLASFTSWSAVQPGTAVEVKGLGMQAPYQWSGTNISAMDAVGDVAASAILTFDANSALGTLFLTSGSVSMDFPATEISSLSADPAFLVAKNSANAAVFSDPKSQAWNYQSFGVWETGRNARRGDLGVFSLGNADQTSIPDTGTASFSGKVIGSYVNAAGEGHTVLAVLSVDVSWTDRSLALSTTNTRIAANGVSFGDEVTAMNLPKSDPANPTLNTLSYQAGTNSFSGTLTTAGGLEGPSAGQFYGPSAEELGGVFFLQASSGVESYRGAYGAQQVTAP